MSLCIALFALLGVAEGLRLGASTLSMTAGSKKKVRLAHCLPAD